MAKELPLNEMAAFFREKAASFKVFLDDACAMPVDWRETWNASVQWGLFGNGHWATKYGAQGFLPHMLESSPFVTTDWRQAAASVVVVRRAARTPPRTRGASRLSSDLLLPTRAPSLYRVTRRVSAQLYARHQAAGVSIGQQQCL